MPSARRIRGSRSRSPAPAYVAAIRTLWAEDVASFSGEFTRVESVRVNPKPVRGRRIPVVIGGNSDGALARVAAFGDGWYGFNIPATAVAGAVAALAEQCQVRGRSMRDLSVAVALAGGSPGMLSELAGMSVTEFVVVAAPPADSASATAWVRELAAQWVVAAGQWALCATFTARSRGRCGPGSGTSLESERRDSRGVERAVLMKLPYVEYEAPTTVAEAVDLLAEYQDEASVLAGGQSLIPLLALRLARPAVLIDINGLRELSGVSVTEGRVAIGAMTREYVAEESETVADTVPLLAAALPLIGHEAIRSRGTIGGSLAHADPAAELPAVARALDAEFVLRSRSGDRIVTAAEWFEGYLATSRRPDEILVEVRFPAAGSDTGVAFQEVVRRHGDFAIVGLAASLTLADGAISDARLAFSGVADVPVRAADAEDLLVGERPSTELFDEAARRATADIDPPADLHGSSGYRKKVAATLVRRGLQAAADNVYERQ
jgi:carbon-monoxide dehydrogenase medium subunit